MCAAPTEPTKARGAPAGCAKVPRMVRALSILALVSLATVLACGDDPGLEGDDAPVDGGKDAGGKDAGGKDAGGKDAAAPSRDAGTKDSGGGQPDADVDAGPIDTDAAVEDDAGNAHDAGADAATGDDGGAAHDGGVGIAGEIWINEILADPPGTDGNNEFVELKCQPGLALDPYWFVVADGDQASNDASLPGKVTLKKKLTGVVCGASGFVILQRGGVYDGVAGTTYADAFFPNSTNLENGSQTYLLIQADTFDATDVDVDDDGILDAAVAAGVVDSVAMLDGTAGDEAYSPAVLAGNDDTAALSRFADAAAIEAASWYFGLVKGPSPYTYDTSDVSASFPAGGTLSPGAANSPKP